MNSSEVKRILAAYRPGFDDDPVDPEISAALDCAQKDPELRDWLEVQQTFHESVGTALRGIPVPPDLKTRILREQKIVPLWRKPQWLLMAACLAAALAIAALWLVRPNENESFVGFRSRMVSFALREYGMDIVTNSATQIRQYLRGKGAPDYVLSAGLQKTPVMGGGKLSWQGHPVSMVCFSLPKQQILFMFVMDQGALRRGQAPGNAPEVEPFKTLTTASWERDGKVYLIAAKDQAAIERSLPQP